MDRFVEKQINKFLKLQNLKLFRIIFFIIIFKILNYYMNRSISTLGNKTKFKLVFLGDQNTGKTSIIERFVNNSFEQKINPTIGIDFLGKNVPYKNKTYRLQLWDTAGQQRFRSLIPSYLKDAICAIYVFDVSNPQTLQNLERWIYMFKQNKGGMSITAICANKSDLEKRYEKSKLDKILIKNKIPVFQVSAKTGKNISQMFLVLIQMIIQLNTKLKITEKTQLIEDEINPPLTTQPLHLNQVTNQNQQFIEKKKKCYC